MPTLSTLPTLIIDTFRFTSLCVAISEGSRAVVFRGYLGVRIGGLGLTLAVPLQWPENVLGKLSVRRGDADSQRAP